MAYVLCIWVTTALQKLRMNADKYNLLYVPAALQRMNPDFLRT